MNTFCIQSIEKGYVRSLSQELKDFDPTSFGPLLLQMNQCSNKHFGRLL